MYFEKTPSGGYHAVYRCEGVVSPNRKLARKVIECEDDTPLQYRGKKFKPRKRNGRWVVEVCMIETRGEGGLVLVAPSPGYEAVQGDLSDLPVLTAEERELLLSCARALDEIPPEEPTVPSRPAVSGGDRPGDDFNQRGDISVMLLKHGWTLDCEGANEHWTRPGKDGGCSATFNGSVFYVFSTNAPPFEAGRGYSQFAVYSLLKHEGDFAAAAKALASEGYGRPAQDADDEPAVDVEEVIERARAQDSLAPVFDAVDGFARLDVASIAKAEDQLRHGFGRRFRVSAFRKAVKDARTHLPTSTSWFCNDRFIPRQLALEILNRARADGREYKYGFDPKTGAGVLMEYSGGVWRRAIDIERHMHILLADDSTRHRIAEAVAALIHEVEHIVWPEWNREPFWANCANGMIDAKTLEVHPHDPRLLSTFQIPWAWDPDAEFVRLDQFVLEVMPGRNGPDATDADIAAAEAGRELLLHTCGATLIPAQVLKGCVILLGPTDGAKTTFINLLERLLGPHNIAKVTMHELAENQFASARLENRLVGLADDLDGVSLRSMGHLKELTGGPTSIAVERKGQDAYEAPMYATLVFTANEIPVAPDRSDAWYNRLIIIPFPHRFDRNTTPPKDRTLGKVLQSDAAVKRLLHLLIAGLHRLAMNGFELPANRHMAEQVEHYKLKSDSVYAFVNEHRRLDSAASIRKSRWHRAYRQFCEATDEFTIGRNKAYERLESQFSVRVETDPAGYDVFAGIDLDPLRPLPSGGYRSW